MSVTDFDFPLASYAQVELTFGDPDRIVDFVLGPATTEFRIKLLNLFDKKDMSDEYPAISERTWNLNGEQNLTIWYQVTGQGLVYADHLLWHPDDQF